MTKNAWCVATTVVIAWVLVARGHAQESRWPRAEAVDAAVAEQMKTTGAVGCAVGIIEDGKIVYLKGYGLADREKNVPVDTHTLFRWASVSKPITAVAALQLVEKGQLDLDKDIREYVPEFPDKGVKITARQLLCHQGGIVHYANGKVIRTQRKYDSPNPFEDVVLGLDNFKESPLVNQPGEKYSYSTHGYNLLSAVVERAGKQKFADQVRDRICKPLGLATLQPDYQWVNLSNRAVGYRKPWDKPTPSSNTDVSWKLGGGGFISSIEDMAKFGAGLAGHKLLKPETEKLMWTRQKLKDGTETSYGLGVSVARGPNGLFISHSGSQEKAKTYMGLWPEQGKGVVFMTNSEFVDPGAFATVLRKAAWPAK